MRFYFIFILLLFLFLFYFDTKIIKINQFQIAPKGLLALGVLGKQIRFIYLKAPTLQGKDEWTEKIQDAQNALNEKTSCVKLTPILSNLKFKTYEDQKINCCVPFESGYVMGAEHGVFACKNPCKISSFYYLFIYLFYFIILTLCY